MPASFPRLAIWLLAWGLIGAVGSVLLARDRLSQLRNAFDTDARIVHRLLSQRVVQHDALLSSMALLQPPAGGEQRLSSVYPQILEVKRREGAAQWSYPDLTQAEARSRSLRRAELARLEFAQGRYVLVSAAEPASFALRLDLNAIVPWAEWPMNPKSSPVRVSLEHQGQQYIVQPGELGSGDWRFEAQKNLASESQPFNVVAVQQVAWSQLPWLRIAFWLMLVAALLAALFGLLRQREQRRRAEELLRLGQVARLNQMGELAAGLAHELNQPLTAVLANTQAAHRLLDDDPPELDTAREAMKQAATQARRASDVIARLRRSIDPSTSAILQSVSLADAAKAALNLLEPELHKHHVNATLDAPQPVFVQADPIALEQIIHNLLTNAIQAMANTPASQRSLMLSVASESANGVLSVQDSGSGISPEALPRVFEPFFSTREGGLGLGLSLCESLAEKMGGRLTASNHAPTGAVFQLTLALAQRSPS
ncbi:ATP-binding protein [Variovorax sp. PCZ-1]|uniref:sensor histidine kinase n=1 Tax=Variovorax sp. PCZ-1 TaxID=2835533 RepID=UPI001BCB4F14|nr:ATP-binding protein [Variovorax sp. PCZ-1]MBS7808737.1 GHKL domain-containing protein [Variovorax sp. PCZ-1]